MTLATRNRRSPRLHLPRATEGEALAEADPRARPEPVRILRVIARMNIGGPAYHVSLLSGRMDPQRYATLLVHGEVGAGESSFAALAEEEGCVVHSLPSLGPQVQLVADLKALADLLRIVRRFRPHVVHTHTAKAGTLGRLAAWLGGHPRPAIVHTYHGHVVAGQHFGPIMTRVYRTIERRLASVSDCLVGVSQATVDDLVKLRVASADSFRVIPLGLDLERFFDLSPGAGRDFRRRVGAGPDDVVLTCVCRLAPIKRVDVLLRAMARLRATHPRLRLAIVGDGECRAVLEPLAEELDLDEAVTFVGYLTDVVPVAAAADVAVLSSDDEGTPVSLIEAAAAAVPAVATTVGGNADVVPPDAGILVPPGDDEALASALARVAGDAALRARMGANARAHVRERFAVERLLEDVGELYDDLLRRRARRTPQPLRSRLQASGRRKRWLGKVGQRATHSTRRAPVRPGSASSAPGLAERDRGQNEIRG